MLCLCIVEPDSTLSSSSPTHGSYEIKNRMKITYHAGIDSESTGGGDLRGREIVAREMRTMLEINEGFGFFFCSVEIGEEEGQEDCR